MGLEKRLLKFGIKGILVTDRPFFIDCKNKEVRYFSIRQMKDFLWSNAIDLDKYDIINYNLLDNDFDRIKKIYDCIIEFNDKYERKDNHKYSYSKLLDKYASMLYKL